MEPLCLSCLFRSYRSGFSLRACDRSSSLYALHTCDKTVITSRNSTTAPPSEIFPQSHPFYPEPDKSQEAHENQTCEKPPWIGGEQARYDCAQGNYNIQKDKRYKIVNVEFPFDWLLCHFYPYPRATVARTHPPAYRAGSLTPCGCAPTSSQPIDEYTCPSCASTK